VAKKKPDAATGDEGKKSAAKPPSRSARIKHGRAVLEAVKNRVNEYELKAMTEMNGPRLTKATHKKYLAEEITNYAWDSGLSEADIGICVQLVQLLNRLDDKKLEGAVTSGKLPLSGPDLKRLLKLTDDDLETQLLALLSEQI